MNNWDKHKEEANRKKHGISFLEASKVFEDPLRITSCDVVNGELRYCTVGKIGARQSVLVVYCEEPAGTHSSLRIISARFLTKHELRDIETSSLKPAEQVLGHAAFDGARAWFGVNGYREIKRGKR